VSGSSRSGATLPSLSLLSATAAWPAATARAWKPQHRRRGRWGRHAETEYPDPAGSTAWRAGPSVAGTAGVLGWRCSSRPIQPPSAPCRGALSKPASRQHETPAVREIRAPQDDHRVSLIRDEGIAQTA